MRQLKFKCVISTKVIVCLVCIICNINVYAQDNKTLKSKLDKALSYAGENKQELLKVLQSFKIIQIFVLFI